MSTVLSDADDIRRQMALIRHDLDADVRGVVATAEAATDWRSYLGMYPWVSLGAAFAAGYLIVPSRRKAESSTRHELAKVRQVVEETKQTVAQAVNSPVDTSPRRRKNLIGAALGLIAPVALRAAQGYALQYLEQWITRQQLQTGAGPRPEPRTAATRPRGPGTL